MILRPVYPKAIPLIATDRVLPRPWLDTREQPRSPRLWSQWWPVDTERKTLDTADATCGGFENVVRLEGKGFADLRQCATTGRPRWERMLERLRAFPVRYVIVEATWQDVWAGGWAHTALTPLALEGSIHAWQRRFDVPFILAGDAAGAARVAWGIMRRVVLDAHKAQKAEAKALRANWKSATDEGPIS